MSLYPSDLYQCQNGDHGGCELDSVAKGGGTYEKGGPRIQGPSNAEDIVFLFQKSVHWWLILQKIANQCDKQYGLKGMAHRLLHKVRLECSMGHFSSPQITTLIVQLVQLPTYLPNRMKETLLGLLLGQLLYSHSGGVGPRPPLPPSLILFQTPENCVSKKNTTSFWSQIP